MTRNPFKIFLITLMIALLVPVFAVSAAEAERTVITSGYCGMTAERLSYTLYSDGELVISGKGEMKRWGYGQTPWYEYRDLITSAVIGDGVTSIGFNAFHDTALASVEIADTVKSIESEAFSNCKLTSVELPRSLQSLGYDVFS